MAEWEHVNFCDVTQIRKFAASDILSLDYRRRANVIDVT
jgi:hypothetical protein